MADEFVNELYDVVKVRFTRSEQRVADINHNANIPMVGLNNKLGICGEDRFRMQSINQNGDQKIVEKRITSQRKNPKNINPVQVP